MISSIIAFIIGGLFLGMYYNLFVLAIFILKLFKKDNLSLILYLLYLISIGYFLDSKSIYENYDIIFFIVIPSILVLSDILKNNYIYERYEILWAFLLILGYFNKYIFMILVLSKLFICLYNEMYIKGVVVYILFIILFLTTFVIGYNLLNENYLGQVIVIIALGLISFLGFLLTK